MSSNKCKIIGPTRRDKCVPLISSGKQRLTVMFCGNASGQMMPLYLVYPELKSRGYNPLTGVLEGSDIAYTPKEWMDKTTFSKFLEFIDKNAGTERPVVLLFDSVSSHIDHDIFMKAKSMNIELYRIVPKATHIMQPLDKGAFGPLKLEWHLTTKTYARVYPWKVCWKRKLRSKTH